MPPEVAVAGLLAVLALGASFATWAPKVAANVTSVLIVSVVVCTRLYATVVPPRYLLATFLALGAVSCLLCVPDKVANRTFSSVMILGFTSLMLVVFLEFRLTTASSDAAFFGYFVVVPLAAVYGYLLVKSGRSVQMGRAFLAVAALSAALALVERAINGPILAGNQFDLFISGGQYRASVFSEQALVLASLFLCALPIAFVTTKGVVRAAAIILLLGGISATFSRGALALAAAYLIGAIIWRSVPSIHRYGTVLRAALLAVFVAVPLLLFWQPWGSGGVTSSDPSTASVQYRGAIYPLTMSSLESRPFGWGPAGPPPGEYTFRSPFGILDVANSIDSELVQTMMEFGYPGAVLLAGVAAVAVLRIRTGRWWSHIAVLITGAGLYLSIHSWVGLLGLWALSVGATFANPPAEDTDGPRARVETARQPAIPTLQQDLSNADVVTDTTLVSGKSV